MNNSEGSKLMNSQEKLIAFLAGFFTWFIGGFILAQIYRSKGYAEKAKQVSKYALLGIGISLIALMGALLINMSNRYNNPQGRSSEEIERIIPRLENYLDN